MGEQEGYMKETSGGEGRIHTRHRSPWKHVVKVTCVVMRFNDAKGRKGRCLLIATSTDPISWSLFAICVVNEKLKCESCRTRIPYRATEVRFSGTIIIASIRKRFERNTEGKGGREIDIRRSNSPLFRIRGNTKFHISFLVSRNNSSPRRVRRWRERNFAA